MLERKYKTEITLRNGLIVDKERKNRKRRKFRKKSAGNRAR